MSGRCSVCHVHGPQSRVRHFLCERCAHPLEVRTYCARCGDRQRFPGARGIEFLFHARPGEQPSLGTALRLQGCSKCDPHGTHAPGHVHVIRGMRERTVEILERCAHAEQLGIVPELPGLCAACHMPSTQPHAGRFLCAACSAPHVIQTYCANCGTRETCATPTAALDAFHDAHLGAVIGTEYCAYCDPEHAPGAVRVIQPAETLPQRTNATA